MDQPLIVQGCFSTCCVMFWVVVFLVWKFLKELFGGWLHQNHPKPAKHAHKCDLFSSFCWFLDFLRWKNMRTKYIEMVVSEASSMLSPANTCGLFRGIWMTNLRSWGILDKYCISTIIHVKVNMENWRKSCYTINIPTCYLYHGLLRHKWR